MQVKGSYKDVGFFRKEAFFLQNSAWTCDELYGGDLDGISTGGFFYAAEADLNELIPDATLVRNRYKGNVTFGSIPNGNYVIEEGVEPSSINPGGWSINQLI